MKSRVDKIVDELRDFNHYEAADFILELVAELDDVEKRYEAAIERLEGKIITAKVDALREAAEELALDKVHVQSSNGIGWIPRNSLVGASRWLKAEADKLELQQRFENQEETRRRAILELVALEDWE